jgi:hypothetical protein
MNVVHAAAPPAPGQPRRWPRLAPRVSGNRPGWLAAAGTLAVIVAERLSGGGSRRIRSARSLPTAR